MPESQRPPEMLTADDVAGVLAAIQTIIARGDQAAVRVIRVETGLGSNQVSWALRNLQHGGKIIVVGKRSKAHWRLVVDVDNVRGTHCPLAYCAPVQGAELVAPLPVPESDADPGKDSRETYRRQVERRKAELARLKKGAT